MSRNVVQGLIFLVICAALMIIVGWITEMAMSAEPPPAGGCQAIYTGATCNVVCWPE